ncbi:hypothetical protein IWQ60_008787 [Tieghemiomyces parasiticus]|uniref:Transcription initiation factor TFIID subunit 10 n=1 Tax=Tieghemiomyces parasiticus TaxID=78921 RepID=A0A9W7ZRF2_9FUNG|nr:hypothetical protein IWQ60_008787 [Tieghemiomyces parasiticus]
MADTPHQPESTAMDTDPQPTTALALAEPNESQHPASDMSGEPASDAPHSPPPATADASTHGAPSTSAPGAPMTDDSATRSLNAKEKSLAEFLLTMDDRQPLIPDAVTEYYLARTGFECDDIRIKRLLALVAQKFVSDVVTDAYQYSRVQQLGNKERKLTKKDRRAVLTMDDLSKALQEYGVNIRKPDYYS